MSKKLFLNILLISLVMLLLFFIVFAVWFTYNSVQLGHESSVKEDIPLSVGDVEEKGIKLSASEPTVLSNDVITQQLTAQVLPADADVKTVSWSVSWQNPSSAFATGKNVTDYVTVSPVSTGALTATLSCVQDFGEKIVVKVTSDDNAEIFATAVCDYLQRVKSLVFTLNDIEMIGTGYTYDVVYSNYTIPVEIELSFGNKIYLNSSFATSITNRFNSLNCGYRIPTDWWFASDYGATVINNAETQTLVFYASDKSFAGCFGSPDDEYSSSEIAEMKSNVNNAFRYAAVNYDGVQATFEVSYTMTYQDKVYDSGTYTVECMFDVESIKIDVTKVTLSSNRVVF